MDVNVDVDVDTNTDTGPIPDSRFQILRIHPGGQSRDRAQVSQGVSAGQSRAVVGTAGGTGWDSRNFPGFPSVLSES